MEKRKTTVYLDDDVLTAAKAVAVASRRSESAVIEDALRLYLRDGRGEAVGDELSALMARVAGRSGLDEDAAITLAVDEVRAARRDRRPVASGS